MWSTPGPDIDMVWAQALQLANEKLGDINLPSLSRTLLHNCLGGILRLSPVIEALDTLQTAEKDKRWHWTWSGKRVIIVESLGKFLNNAEPYSGIVNTSIQRNLEVAALVWAGN